MTEQSFRVVIPARYESSRLPGKVLRDLAGRPMLEHVWQRACDSDAAEVVIATDSAIVADRAAEFGADVCLTSGDCHSGTDRVAEVCEQRSWDGDALVVNLQGDAPLMPPASINRVAGLLAEHPDAAIATLCTALRSPEDYGDPHVVKVVFDSGGRALYFSRASIPATGHGSDAGEAWQASWRHLGLYAYRVTALRILSRTPPSPLEKLERLEQLRAMWLGLEIRIAIDDQEHGPDVDTEEDLERVAGLLAGRAEV